MRRAGASLFLLVAMAAAAHADALDGDWCSADGRHLSIDGAYIVTPEGTLTTGQYGRHEFAYAPPAGSPDQGAIIYMRQFSEAHMGLARIVDGELGPVEDWRRCDVTS